MTLDLRRRSAGAEWMDDITVPDAEYAACLSDLGQVNRLLGAYGPTLLFLSRVVRGLPKDRPIRILDVGAGHGDMLRRIWRWGCRRGLVLELEGLDLSPQGTAAARAATPPEARIRWRTGDVFALDPAERWDVVVSGLMTHHLDDAQIIRFLRWMDGAADLGWFVNDLHRHALAYHGFRALAALAGWHRFVRHDGAVSVARAFRPDEWRDLLRRAGVAGEVRWHPMFRLCVGHAVAGPRR